MAYPRSALLFSYRYIPTLADLRSPQWQQLVQRVSALPEDHEETLSLCLLIIELCDCMGCDINSYKASLGCRTCARRAISGHKGTDLALQRKFESVKKKLAVAKRTGKSAKLISVQAEEATEHDEEEEEETAPPPRRRRKADQD
jgi:hypothetical protein